MHKSARLTHLKGNFMSNNTTADVTGIFSLDTNRLVGLAAKGSPDVTYTDVGYSADCNPLGWGGWIFVGHPGHERRRPRRLFGAAAAEWAPPGRWPYIFNFRVPNFGSPPREDFQRTGCVFRKNWHCRQSVAICVLGSRAGYFLRCCSIGSRESCDDEP